MLCIRSEYALELGKFPLYTNHISIYRIYIKSIPTRQRDTQSINILQSAAYSRGIRTTWDNVWRVWRAYMARMDTVSMRYGYTINPP